jgi:hypothetical protein
MIGSWRVRQAKTDACLVPFVPVSFYEAEFVKTRCENSFLFILIHFGRHLAATYLLAFGA